MTPPLDVIARVPMAPLLAAQAGWVAATAKRYPEAAGPRRGRAGQGPALRVLILGDSSAAGVGVPTQDLALSGHLVRALATSYRVDWRLEARNGATTAAALKTARGLPGSAFDLALIALGVNDVKNGVRRGRWRRDYAALMDLIAGRCGARLICASGLPPVGRLPLLPQPLRWVLGQRAERFDADLRRLTAARSDAAHIPLCFDLEASAMAADGFHPGPPVFAEWARAVRAVLERRMPAP